MYPCAVSEVAALAADQTSILSKEAEKIIPGTLAKHTITRGGCGLVVPGPSMFMCRERPPQPSTQISPQ